MKKKQEVLLTIRVEKDLQTKFKTWCVANKKSMKIVLLEKIKKCVGEK